MTNQNPSTIVGSDIDLGNCIVYYSSTHFTSFSSAQSSTKWRKLGILKEGCQLDIPKEILEIFSGYPATLQQQFINAEDLQLSGQILEVTPRKLALIFGGLTVTETVKASSPAPTTVATGSTKTVVNVASATGYVAKDEIRVGNSGSYQYGRIKSIAGNALTLYEGLSGDSNPTTGHAVAKIDTAYFETGALATPANVGIKISKTLVGGWGSYDIIIPKAQFSGDASMAFQDNTKSAEPMGVPFALKALSDPDVESGKTARFLFTHTNT